MKYLGNFCQIAAAAASLTGKAISFFTHPVHRILIYIMENLT